MSIWYLIPVVFSKGIPEQVTEESAARDLFLEINELGKDTQGRKIIRFDEPKKHSLWHLFLRKTGIANSRLMSKLEAEIDDLDKSKPRNRAPFPKGSVKDDVINMRKACNLIEETHLSAFHQKRLDKIRNKIQIICNQYEISPDVNPSNIGNDDL